MDLYYCVAYTEIYPNDKYKGDMSYYQHVDGLLFEDVIKVNPHNIKIQHVSVNGKTLYNRLLGEFGTLRGMKIIIKISGRFGNDKKHLDELLHLVDLWFSKFAQDKDE